MTVAGSANNAPPGFGLPGPFFTAATDGYPNYSIAVAAGRWMVLMFFASLSNGVCRAAHEQIVARSGLFNDTDAAFYGVSIDPADQTERGLHNAPYGIRYFWDFDRAVSSLYGLVSDTHLQPAIFLLDRSFRIVEAEAIEHTSAVLDRLQAELAAEQATSQNALAPVLTLPRVFEPEFCQRLIGYAQSQTPSRSGFAVEVEGRTVDLLDPQVKRRDDVVIEDSALRIEVQDRLRSRLVPMVKRSFGWQATQIERYVIGRYGYEQNDFFSAHRDDVTPGTAHRKFAVTINLNADEYEGGDLRFPEFGDRTYRPPTGGATVFCCSLLHAVTPVMRGVRYALLPFLYDEAGRIVRRDNLAREATVPGRTETPR